MGFSAQKKRDKKKDFQKPKLKVGKARPKPSNTTDTSFKSKSIVLAQQSLKTTAPSASAQFSHNFSLLSSRSSTQKRDSLAYLTAAVTSRPINSPLPLPVSILLPKLSPLMLDGTNGVRSQLLSLLRGLPAQDIGSHIGQIVLYIRAGLTHLAVDIRSSAIDFLVWALETCPNEVVSCAGGWVKTLKCLLTILHWHDSDTNRTPKSGSKISNMWISIPAPNLGNAGSEGNLPTKCLAALASFLRVGLTSDPTTFEPNSSEEKWPFPLRHVECHMRPSRSNPFADLNLFGAARDEEGDMYIEREERQRIFQKRFRVAVSLGVESAKREGGEVGRAAANVGKAVAEGMQGNEDEED